MAGRETADIVFCMDASGSMETAFEGVRDHVEKLVETLNTTGLQRTWDVRFDFLAYSNTRSSMRLMNVEKKGVDLVKALYEGEEAMELQSESSPSFFTRDLKKFTRALNEVRCEGDETTLLALDIAADFPFRDASSCHRVVVLLTDEPVADGPLADETASKLMDLAKKYQDKKIMLFMVTPDCPTFDSLSQIDKCEWTVDESGGLKTIDFSKLMESIGKSVSISQTSGSAASNSPMPLFCESKWTTLAHYGDCSDPYVMIEGVRESHKKSRQGFI